MSAHALLSAPPQARSRAGMLMETATDRPAESRPGKAKCGVCGQAWFGDVAYCPYCGRRSASTPADPGAHALAAADCQAVARAHTGAPLPPALTPEPGSRATQALAAYVHSYAGRMRLFHAPERALPGHRAMRWMTRWMGILASAVALALVGLGLQDVVERTNGRAGQPGARPAPAAGAAGDTRSEASARVAAPRASSAAVTAPAAPSRGASSPTARAPPAEPVMPRAETAPAQPPPAPAPPARNRSLCSAANEAAGLCNPQ